MKDESARMACGRFFIPLAQLYLDGNYNLNNI